MPAPPSTALSSSLVSGSPRKPAAIAKISAPSYYNYKAAALQRVDFTPLAAIGQSASLDQATAGTAFREAVTGLSGFELFAEAEIAKALVSYYSAKPDFIWVTGDEVNERGRDALRVLGEAASHGLSPADYAISIPSGSIGDTAARKSDLIRFEMALSARVLRYAHDAEGGVLVGRHGIGQVVYQRAMRLEHQREREVAGEAHPDRADARAAALRMRQPRQRAQPAGRRARLGDT